MVLTVLLSPVAVACAVYQTGGLRAVGGGMRSTDSIDVIVPFLT